MLYEVDYLLGVHDLYRQGALRFKKSLNGEFLDNDERLAAPPISSLKELEYAALQVEAIDFFQLEEAEAEKIKDEVLASVSQWEHVAKRIGISRGEQQMMSPAFNV